MRRHVSFLAVIIVFGGMLFIAGVHVGAQYISGAQNILGVTNIDGDPLTKIPGEHPVDFTPYWRVWNILERKFIPHGTSTTDHVPAEEKMYRSIEGLVASYNDPYTVFMRPRVSSNFKIATRGALEGIGAVIGMRNGDLIVVAPLKGSPAHKAGLQHGDQIVAINGTSTENMSIDTAVGFIRGKRGSNVTLRIVRAGEEKTIDVLRGTIEIPSTSHAKIERNVPRKIAQNNSATAIHAVSNAHEEKEPTIEGEREDVMQMEKKDFYIIKLFSFSQSSIRAFERELRAFVASGADSLIIDLRGNPGGYLESAVRIAGLFLPRESVVAREYRGPQRKEVVHKTTRDPLLRAPLPRIAVLVDKGSASASEILAGALHEYGVATLVGTQTFGKGSVQELINITDTLSLKVTVARWYTPHGISISQVGLTPDVVVDLTHASSTTPFIDAAVEALST